MCVCIEQVQENTQAYIVLVTNKAMIGENCIILKYNQHR